jgi:hypothetical protein
VYLDNTWVFFAITIPLTIVTLAIWWFMARVPAFLGSIKAWRLGYVVDAFRPREKPGVVKESA